MLLGRAVTPGLAGGVRRLAVATAVHRAALQPRLGRPRVPRSVYAVPAAVAVVPGAAADIGSPEYGVVRLN